MQRFSELKTNITKNNIRYVYFIYAIAFAISIAIVYKGGLHSPFLLDDYGNIVGNHFIEIEKLSFSSLQNAWHGPHIEKHRKLSYLTFALNYLWTGYNSVSFHVTNIAIHIICSLLIFVFSYQTLGIGWLREQYGGFRHWLSISVSMTWALHPVQVNAVTYIVQRMTSLAVMFALLALIAWLAGRKCWIQHHRFQASLFWGLAIISWCLGLLSKEHVAIVPLLILVHEVFLLRRGTLNRIQLFWLAIGGVTVVGVAFFYLGLDPLHRISAGYSKRDFTMLERLLTEARVLWHYISLFCFPVSERFALFYEYPISKGLFLPITTFLSSIAWIGVILSAWVYRKKYPVFTWMIAWFLTAHLIESTIIPLEIIFEHRMYLPSIALAFGMVLIGYDFLLEQTKKRWIPIFTLSAFLCIISVSTYSRNMDFRDEVTLYQSELRKFPDSKRNRLGLALALNRSGRFDEGGKMLGEMAEKAPTNFVVQQNWYNFLVRVKQDRLLSEDVYHNLLRLIEQGHYNRYHDAMALKNLTELLFEEGDYQRALVMVDRLVADYPRGPFFLLKGICHAKLKNWPYAKHAFYEAWNRTPKDLSMVYWYGMSLIQMNEKDRGCLLLSEGIQREMENQNLRSLCQNLLDDQCQGLN